MQPNFLTFLLTNKKKILNLYKVLYILSFLLPFLLLIPNFHSYWRDTGRISANLSVMFFSLATLPGILNRLSVTGFLKQSQIILMLFRRQHGILMFIFALSHYLLIRIYPIISIKGNLLNINLFELFGFIAFILSAPLFITSNNFSQSKLAHKWAILHRLVYLICWMIFLHLVTMPRINWSTVLIYLICILEIISWTIKLKFIKKHNTTSTSQL